MKLNKIFKNIPRWTLFVLTLSFVLNLAIFFIPATVAAEDDCSTAPEGGKGILTAPLSNECINCGYCTKCDLVRMISAIATGTVKATGPIATFAIVVSGIFYVISAGREGGPDSMLSVSRAKAALTASITGTLVVLCAWLIVNMIMFALGYSESFFGDHWSTIQC